MSKKKGTNAERELIRMFWSHSWAAIRAAGSGSMHYPCPDILASNKRRRLAIEVKTTHNSSKYIAKEEIKQLINFCEFFGAEPWIGVKFLRKSWAFLPPEDLRKTNSSYVFSIKDNKALSFEELIEII